MRFVEERFGQSIASDSGAKNGGQIVLVGFVIGVGRLTMVLGGEGMNDADVERSVTKDCALESAFDGQVIVAGAFHGHHNIFELMLVGDLAYLNDGQFEPSAVMLNTGGLDEQLAIEVADQPHGACFGAIETNNAEVLGADLLDTWVQEAEELGQRKTPTRDAVLSELVPNGPKEFPAEFVNGNAAADVLSLPTEPVSVVQLPTGDYVVQSDFGFRHPVRNPTEGNFILYAFLRGHRRVQVPKQMIDIFKAVKAYENYLRDLRHALLQAYERKSGHRPMAEHQAKEVFASLGLPWL
jgi:hypothetical protein